MVLPCSHSTFISNNYYGRKMSSETLFLGVVMQLLLRFLTIRLFAHANTSS